MVLVPYFLTNFPSERDRRYKAIRHLHKYYKSTALQEIFHLHAQTNTVLFIKDKSSKNKTDHF